MQNRSNSVASFKTILSKTNLSTDYKHSPVYIPRPSLYLFLSLETETCHIQRKLSFLVYLRVPLAVYSLFSSGGVSCPVRAKTHHYVSESTFVIRPAAIDEINGAIESLLEHCPAPTGRFLVAKHFKRTLAIGVDCINSCDSLAGFEQFSTVFQGCGETSNNQLA